jgi:leucyl/phenylalanyl-tRNA---protein transferase
VLAWLRSNDPFPSVESAAAYPNGLLCAGGDLSPWRLIEAYRHGIFPWFANDEPVLWWSPDPRTVLFPGEFKISRSLRKTLRRGDFEVRIDTAFSEVIAACAAPRRDQPGTWISSRIIEAYERLQRLGAAHSVETWIDGQLVGGLYGVAVGRMFYGESMFSRASDASKIALAHLVHIAQKRSIGLIDCQMSTPHLLSLGARTIPRSEFIAIVAELANRNEAPEPWLAGERLEF